jgi:hypothetical protein
MPTLSAVTRRSLVKNLALAAGVSVTLPLRQSMGAEPPRLDVKDPAAVALGYVEIASQVDVKKFPGYVKGSICENCSQLQGAAGSSYRPCELFSGKLVSAKGWCSGFAAEI